MQLNYFKSLETRRKAETKLIELLGLISANSNSPHETSFWFYGEEAHIYRLAALIQEKGFHIISTVQSKPDRDEWLLIASKVMVINELSFLELTEAMDDLAEAYRCQYDGYEIAI